MYVYIKRNFAWISSSWTHCINAELLCLQSFKKVWFCSYIRGRKRPLCQLKCERKQTHPRWFLFDENSIWLCFEPPTFSKARRANGNIMRIPPLEFTPFFYWPSLWSMFWRVIKKQEMSYYINQKNNNTHHMIPKSINQKICVPFPGYCLRPLKLVTPQDNKPRHFKSSSLFGYTSKTYGSHEHMITKTCLLNTLNGKLKGPILCKIHCASVF